MKMNKSSLLCIVVLSFSGLMVAQDSSRPHPDATLSLRDGWALQSSCKVDAKGETLSTPAFRPKDWYEVVRPHHRGRGTGQAQGLSRSVFRHQSANFSRGHLSHRGKFLQHPDAAGQPFHRPLVVSQGIRAARQLQGQEHLAELRRDQLPRQHLPQWQAAGQVRRRSRRLANLRVQHHRRRSAWKAECAGGAGFLPHRYRPGHHFRGLEPRAPGQEHGPVSRRGHHHQRARSRALSRRGFESRFAGQ